MPPTQIFSSLCNLVMVFTFNTFKLKLYDLTDIKYLRLYYVGLQRYRHFEASEFVTIELESFLVCCYVRCYLQKMRLYSVVFDFYHNKLGIFNSFLIAMVFSFKLNQSPTFFLITVPVRRLYWSDVCICPTLVPVRRLCHPTFIPVRRLYARRL